MTAAGSQSLSVDTALRQAIAHHQAGRLQEAEQLYRVVLQAQPFHADANHKLGVLAGQTGQHALGLPYLKTALAVNPAKGRYALSYAEALLATGQAKEALEVIGNAMQRGLDSPAALALRQKAEAAARGKHATGISGKLFGQTIQVQTNWGGASLAGLPIAKNTVLTKEGSPESRPVFEESLPEAECMRIVALFDSGRYGEMENGARLLVERHPDSGIAWKMLGAALGVQGKQALSALQKAASLLPDDAEAHNNLGNARKDSAQLEDAVTSYRRALEIRPDYAEAHGNLGGVLKDLGQLDAAVASCRRALELRPDLAEAHSNLGNALHDLGQLDNALASYHRALEIKPDFAEARNNLGNALRDQGRLAEAEASFRRAIEIMPDYAEAHNNLGNALKDRGQFDGAVASYRRALEIKPDFAKAHFNLGVVFKDQGRPGAAEAGYRRALEFKPDYVEAHTNLGITLQDQGRLSEAVASFRRALEINPDFAEAHANLGLGLQTLGQVDAAVPSYRRALELKPQYVEAHSNFIFALDLSAEATIPALQQERSRWDSVHAAPLAAMHRPHINRPDPERRLRIGYVSADFRTHSAANVFGAMLVKFDPARFEVFAYSNSRTEDMQTRSFQQGVTCWRKIAGLADEAAACLIREDEIDILVDLSGHSAGNRLLVFARKPAPIQVTAWGYATSTGMRAMDVFFADPVIVPPDEKSLYAEEVRYLPNVVGSFFPQAFPAVNALPALSADGITFGSFNRLTKVSDQAYQVWAQILSTIPESRMVIKAGELDDVGVKVRAMQRFAQAGVDPKRIVLFGKSPWYEHMAAFNQIDIALDPFPHGGGVTALEGLMMGVPLVTLRWPTLVGRLSASILTTLGLTDWIAETREQYVEIARRQAQDLPALATLRARLRGIFISSIIGDAQAYVKAVELEYRQLWREWCARQETVK